MARERKQRLHGVSNLRLIGDWITGLALPRVGQGLKALLQGNPGNRMMRTYPGKRFVSKEVYLCDPFLFRPKRY